MANKPEKENGKPMLSTCETQQFQRKMITEKQIVSSVPIDTKKNLNSVK